MDELDVTAVGGHVERYSPYENPVIHSGGTPGCFSQVSV